MSSLKRRSEREQKSRPDRQGADRIDDGDSVALRGSGQLPIEEDALVGDDERGDIGLATARG